MTRPATEGAEQEFSLVLGGPLYQLFRRAHLSGDALELLWRRIFFLSAIAWLLWLWGVPAVAAGFFADAIPLLAAGAWVLEARAGSGCSPRWPTRSHRRTS